MIILIGSLPPPVGGVSKYCERLFNWLLRQNCEVTLLDSKKLHVAAAFLVRKRFQINLVHVNCSSPILLLVHTLFAKLLTGCPVAITLHTNYDRPRCFTSRIYLNLSLLMANHVLVLNRESYECVSPINRSAFISSSFIPFEISDQASTFADSCVLVFPSLGDSSRVVRSLSSISHNFKLVVSTTAWRRTFQSGREVYGIDQIVALAPRYRDILFLISDPSSDYLRSHVSLELVHDNVSYITTPHEFTSILMYSDLFIRNTLTDGDATSVREALFLGVPVAASMEVSRPKGCITYTSLDHYTFDCILESIQNPSFKRGSNLPLSINDATSLEGQKEMLVTEWYRQFLIPSLPPG